MINRGVLRFIFLLAACFICLKAKSAEDAYKGPEDGGEDQNLMTEALVESEIEDALPVLDGDHARILTPTRFRFRWRGRRGIGSRIFRGRGSRIFWGYLAAGGR
ncbi:unnamed protein product [Schistocephalus solidus]|uniref:Uncharacterized protein n=1 Tax=Schistocephalus solidus TaxID=70667 RepID=A0A183SBA0_SCHSO|nr:unnamed protein product [Schistocephalus solidus]